MDPPQATLKLCVENEDLFLSPPPLGDVDTHANHALRLPVGARKAPSSAGDPADRAVGPNDAELDLEVRPILERTGDGILHPLTVDGMDQPLKGLERTVEASRSDLENFLHVLRADEFVRADVPVPGSHLSGIEGEPESLLALAQRLHGTLPLADVDKRHHGPADLFPLPHRVRPVLDGEAGTVGTPQDLVHDMRPFALAKGLKDPALFHEKSRPVGSAVVNLPVDILAEQIATRHSRGGGGRRRCRRYSGRPCRPRRSPRRWSRGVAGGSPRSPGGPAPPASAR